MKNRETVEGLRVMSSHGALVSFLGKNIISELGNFDFEIKK